MFAMERDGEVQLNPGNEVTIGDEDKIFYICLTEEENAKIISTDEDERQQHEQPQQEKKKHQNGHVTNVTNPLVNNIG